MFAMKSRFRLVPCAALMWWVQIRTCERTGGTWLELKFVPPGSDCGGARTVSIFGPRLAGAPEVHIECRETCIKNFGGLPHAATQCEAGLARSWQHREQDHGGTVKLRWQTRRLVAQSFFRRTGSTLSTGFSVQFVCVLHSKFAAGISHGDE
jgi:hypothetical protein